MALRDMVADAVAKRPPHLRPAVGDPDGDGIPDRCGTCVHFAGGKCKFYGGYPVKPNQVCDSYKAAR